MNLRIILRVIDGNYGLHDPSSVYGSGGVSTEFAAIMEQFSRDEFLDLFVTIIDCGLIDLRRNPSR